MPSIRSPLGWGRLFLDTLLPPLCPGCETELAGMRWICAPCRRGFRRCPRGWICWACRTRTRDEGGREAGYRCAEPDHVRWRGKSAFWMETPLDGVVHRLKYGGRRDLGPALGGLLGRSLEIQGGLALSIPLHRHRLRERGYNQAALLGRSAALRWAAPWIDGVLVRSRPTRAQARLPREERERNVRDAFRAAAPASVEGREWILVDDVATSGNTLLAGAEALYREGASRVIPVSLALA